MTMLSLNACLLLRLRVLRTHLYNLFTDCSNFVALKNIHRFVFSCFLASVRVRDVVFVAAAALFVVVVVVAFVLQVWFLKTLVKLKNLSVII